MLAIITPMFDLFSLHLVGFFAFSSEGSCISCIGSFDLSAGMTEEKGISLRRVCSAFFNSDTFCNNSCGFL